MFGDLFIEVAGGVRFASNMIGRRANCFVCVLKLTLYILSSLLAHEHLLLGCPLLETCFRR